MDLGSTSENAGTLSGNRGVGTFRRLRLQLRVPEPKGAGETSIRINQTAAGRGAMMDRKLRLDEVAGGRPSGAPVTPCPFPLHRTSGAARAAAL